MRRGFMIRGGLNDGSCLQVPGVVSQANVQGGGVGGKREVNKRRFGMLIVEHDLEEDACENHGLTLRDLRERTGC